MIYRKFFLVIFILFICISCLVIHNEAYSKTKIRIMAAASLTESFTEIITNFKKAHPTMDIEVNFAGSSQIVTQLENGVNADIVALASYNSIAPLVKFNLVNSPKNFSTNSLIVATSRKYKNILSLKDLTKAGIKIAIGIKNLPVGEYTYKILDKIDKSGLYGTGYSKKILKNVVTNELDVKSIVNKVELGEVDAGFIYKTDILSQKKSKINIINIPGSVNVVAKYPVAVVKSSKHNNESKIFIDYLLSDKGQKVLEKFGFIPIVK